MIYDGECGLCDATVQRLLRWDKARVLRYTPNQGETFAALSQVFDAPEPGSTVYFLERDGGRWRLHERSRAIFAICARLGWPYKALSWLRIIPRFLTDAGYRLVARFRIRIWGKVDACRLPSPGERALFLP